MPRSITTPSLEVLLQLDPDQAHVETPLQLAPRTADELLADFESAMQVQLEATSAAGYKAPQLQDAMLPRPQVKLSERRVAITRDERSEPSIERLAALLGAK